MKTCYRNTAASAALALLICFSNSKAQQKPAPTDSILHKAVKPTHVVFVELLGPGLVYSANYDTRFTKSNQGIGGRIGIDFLGNTHNNAFIIPVGINYLLGKNGKYFEFGGSVSYYQLQNSFHYFSREGHYRGIYSNLDFGYRYQPSVGNFNFRAGVSPIFIDNTFVPYWPYVSLGYSF